MTRLDRDEAHIFARGFVGEKWKRDAAEVRPSAAACDDHVGIVADFRELLFRLESDHRLMQQHVIEHRAERVVGVGAGRGFLDRLGNRDAQRAGRIGMLLQDVPARRWCACSDSR